MIKKESLKQPRVKEKKYPTKEAPLDYQCISQQKLYRTGVRNDIFKVAKEKQSASVCFLAKLAFRYEGEIKAFPEKN